MPTTRSRLVTRNRALRIVRAIFALLALLPWLASLMAGSPSTQPLATVTSEFYGFQCHQRTERAFTILGQSLPICARCTGIYAGLGLSILVSRPRLRPSSYKAWFLIGAIVIALDVATELVALRPPSAWFRAATGAFLSFPIALAILQTLGSHRNRS